MSTESEAVALLVTLNSAIESNARPLHWLRTYGGLDRHLPIDGDGPLLELAKAYRTKKRGYQQRAARV